MNTTDKEYYTPSFDIRKNPYSKKVYTMAGVLHANKEISAEDKSNVKVVQVSKSLIYQESYLFRAGHGIALIINNMEFHPQLNVEDRRGSDIYAASLIKADKNNLQRTDCLVVVVLSHGEMGCIFATNTTMKIERIMDEFNASNCPELILKPKIFIFQASDACRGYQNDHGYANYFQDSDPYSYPRDKR